MQFVRAGAAFLLVDPRFNNAPHLWVILTDPDSTVADGKIVAVCFVSVRPHTDPTTVLQVGDHPFVRHPTHIDYGSAKLLRVETLEHGQALQRLGCRLAQGYGIARPMPADQLPAWLQDWQQRASM